MKPVQQKDVMPQAVELEEAVLGALLIEPSTMDDCVSILQSPEIFYKEANRYVFLAVSSLYAENGLIDLLTVSQRLRKMEKLEEVGGDFYLINLTQKISSGAHAEYHSRILLQKFLARKIIEFNSRVTALAYQESTDVIELLSKWSGEFDKINEFVMSGRSTIDFPEALRELGKRVEMLTKNQGLNVIDGVRTGFESVDRHTGGWKSGDLIVIGARPGMGKTSYVLRTIIENVKMGVPVGMISLEMDIIQLSARMVAIDTNFHLSQLLKKGFEKDSYFQAYIENTSRMEKYPIYIDDSAKSDIVDVVSQARLWHRMFGIKLLVIDYLQLMVDKTKKQTIDEVSAITRRLKLLAKELKIPIVLLSQLSRKVEERSDKRPRLSDLRESGSIEQDADVVKFLYRPGYYGIEVTDNDMISQGTDSEVIFGKFRGGSVGTIPLKWIGDKTKFVDPLDERDRKYFNDYDF